MLLLLGNHSRNANSILDEIWIILPHGIVSFGPGDVEQLPTFMIYGVEVGKSLGGPSFMNY